MRPRDTSFLLGVVLACLAALPAAAQVQRAVPGDADQTLRALRDEMERSRERLHIKDRERPYFLEYRLLDLEVRTVTASFGAVVNSATTKNRLMEVDVRVGDYHLDSSNFISEDAFQGFIGSSGGVGIDRDYDSLRQDLWLATDQAYKQALESLARKKGYIRSLATPPTADDFSRISQPAVLLGPLQNADWSSRKWEDEARAASAALRKFPGLHSSRVTYYLVFTTRYLLTSEGTQVRVSRSLAAIEASLDTQADDGMKLHHFYTAYTLRPADLPDVASVSKELERTGTELLALRASSPAPDYAGPVLVEAPAAGALLAQMLGPSVSGARSPLSSASFFERMMEGLGGRSEFSGRMGTKVFPAGVTLLDDPTAREFGGVPLLGGYEIDDEGVPPQKVTLVENGTLRGLLMSRRPGADLTQSNGHARMAIQGDARPLMSNVFFQPGQTQPAAELRAKFLELCKAAGRQWCLIVRKMDNPALALGRQEDFMDLFGGMAAGAATGERVPLLVYRVHVADAREELIRGPRLTGLTLKALRSVTAFGDDARVTHFFQNPAPGFAGTAFAAFGSAQGGIPASMVAPSLLFEELEVRGARGEPRRLPIVPPPPLTE